MSTISSKNKTTIIATCTTHIVQDGVSSTIYVLLPILAQTFGLGYAQIGLFKGFKNFSQAAFEICSGWLSERIGEHRLILVGLVLSGAGYLLLSISQSAFGVAICLLTVGAGTALHHAPSSALIANRYPSATRSGALGIYNASGDVGKLAFTGCFSFAAGAGLAWQQISLLYGIVAILTAAGIAVAIRAPIFKRHTETHDKPDTIAQTDPAGWGILNWRSFGALLIVTSIDTLVQATGLVFLAFLMLAKGLSLPVATGATVLLLAGGIFGKAGCGYLANRIGVRTAFAVIQILTAMGLIAVVVAQTAIAFALLIPLGAVMQGTSSITYGFAADLIDHRRMARGYALLYSSGTFASAVGPLGIGIIADKFGIENAIYSVAILAMLAVPPLFALRATSA
ncbi:MAG TPA: MFS transporter [Rhodobacteraceae bacterium]|nr:MFS transporter [Paracoccaceae bacterium]